MIRLRHLFLYLAIALLLIVAAIPATAQGGGQHEKVEAMRVAFLTHRLNLTSEESKHFWPVYNDYRADLTTLRHNFFPKDGGDHHLDADAQLDFEQRKLDLKKRYKPQFEQAIGREKVNLLVGAEEDFKRMLMQTMRNRREHHQGWR